MADALLKRAAHKLSSAATEQNVIIAGAIFFFSYSALRRSNAAFFPDNALAFAPDWTLKYGYSAETVLATNIDPVYLIGATIVNLIAIASFGFLSTSIVSWATETLGESGKHLVFLNVIPGFNALQHTSEAILFLAAVLTQNTEYATLAGIVSEMRTYSSIGSLVLASIASIQFLRVWFGAIGRDGRQKIEKEDKQEKKDK
ncbi:UNVERIFIED_CONTAM: hypothetical protein HDU68_007760 [Siphonaria sp. JEL0065]|nr:hypothetical protein HDU68_007760 [Siphonaria sp. JEL0065]